jgi:hypothetical protein
MTLNSMDNFLFGPISKKYCHLFYFITIFWYILFVLSIISILYMFASKRTNMKMVGGAFAVSLMYFVAYIQNRLFHSICMVSL